MVQAFQLLVQYFFLAEPEGQDLRNAINIERFQLVSPSFFEIVVIDKALEVSIELILQSLFSEVAGYIVEHDGEVRG